MDDELVAGQSDQTTRRSAVRPAESVAGVDSDARLVTTSGNAATVVDRFAAPATSPGVDGARPTSTTGSSRGPSGWGTDAGAARGAWVLITNLEVLAMNPPPLEPLSVVVGVGLLQHWWIVTTLALTVGAIVLGNQVIDGGPSRSSAAPLALHPVAWRRWSVPWAPSRGRHGAQRRAARRGKRLLADGRRRRAPCREHVEPARQLLTQAPQGQLDRRCAGPPHGRACR